ncbi:FAD-dependent oxidoreductase [candidate division LCP-89 bacterium B3_LCP]|uniref:FAD-dependent oxidoreductase n=1 Tax=candidate division LCP-89 bacterium B3_LCP TaxID=2012998 RepID=A0A532V2X5_UNCL8|nr:MAG: FAD-dependent oxidoreductase [candidate division LCP-89 bacterium B3_LCP]
MKSPPRLKGALIFKLEIGNWKNKYMKPVVIIGAGPSGLAAAYELAINSVPVVLIERLGQVGGLSRTIRNNGAHFDVGPHRFFTQNAEIHQLWEDILKENLLSVPRLTRIFYKNKFFYYPLAPMNAFFGVGPVSAAAIVTSYLSTRLSQRISPNEPKNFEEWVVNQFGRKLFETFFKTYTEKVWGIPCTQIGADWAGQRIKGLSLWTAVMNSIFKSKQKNIKTLVDEFVFPRGGAGFFYEGLASVVEDKGGKILLNRYAEGFRHEDSRIKSVILRNESGEREEIEGDAFLVSSPLSDGISGLTPEPPTEVTEAAKGLRYRSHLGVDMQVEGNPFPDNWIYVHSSDVKLARIANYRNFSQEMAGSDSTTPITVEYFCFPGDSVWERKDDELIDLARTELKHMKILQPDQVHSWFIVRNEKAYPVIEIGYESKIQILKSYIARFKNFQPIGRSGMFKYNNMDHAIMTGLLAARNYMGSKFDIWSVNIDAEYHESAEVPQKNHSQ